MPTTVENITRNQILELSREAGAAGDLGQVALCEKALAGDESALKACVRAITYAEAMARS